MNENQETPKPLPLLTDAIGSLFTDECRKITVRITKSIQENGRGFTAISVDPVDDLWKDVDAAVEAVDMTNAEEVAAAMNMTEGTFLLILDKGMFEGVKNMGTFASLDDDMRKYNAQKRPQ